MSASWGSWLGPRARRWKRLRLAKIAAAVIAIGGASAGAACGNSSGPVSATSGAATSGSGSGSASGTGLAGGSSTGSASGGSGAGSQVQTQTATGDTPVIGIDGAGNAIAAWREVADTGQAIWSSRYVAGVGWNSAEEALDTASAPGAFPAIVMSDSGSAIVGFSAGSAIWTNLFTPGSGWAGPQSTCPFAGSYWQLASSATFSFVVAENDEMGESDFTIWSNHIDTSNGGGWQTAEQIGGVVSSQSPPSAREPSVAVQPDGSAVAVWMQLPAETEANQDTVIATNAFAAGSGWQTQGTAPGTLLGDVSPVYAAPAPGGDTLAFWIGPSPGDAQARAFMWTRGSASGPWSDPQTVASPNPVEAETMAVAWRSGHVVAIPYSADTLQAFVFDPTQGWSVSSIPGSSPEQGARPSVAIDASGDAVAVWTQYVTENNTTTLPVWTSRLTADGGWSVARTLSSETMFASEPNVAMNDSGAAMAVWLRDVAGANATVWAAVVP
jgi:hypothetical protein